MLGSRAWAIRGSSARFVRHANILNCISSLSLSASCVKKNNNSPVIVLAYTATPHTTSVTIASRTHTSRHDLGCIPSLATIHYPLYYHRYRHHDRYHYLARRTTHRVRRLSNKAGNQEALCAMLSICTAAAFDASYSTGPCGSLGASQRARRVPSVLKPARRPSSLHCFDLFIE